MWDRLSAYRHIIAIPSIATLTMCAHAIGTPALPCHPWVTNVPDAAKEAPLVVS